MKFRFSRVFLLLFLFLFLIINIFVFAKEKVIIYERTNDSSTMDPSKIRDIYSAEVGYNIYEGLVKLSDKNLKIEPCLAKSWKMLNQGKIWFFYLRRGVKFHNGKEFTSKSVVYSFNHLLNLKGKEQKFIMIRKTISKVEAIDKYTVKIILKKPYPAFITSLSDISFFIVPEGIYKKKNFKPTGTGPFKFLKWEKENSLSLEKNPYYWGKKINIDKIIFRIEKDSFSRLLHLKNNNSNIIIIRSKQEEEELETKQNIKFLTTQKLHVAYLGFNIRKMPFKELKIRKAFASLINKKQLVNFVFQDLAESLSSPLPPNLIGYKDNLDEYKFDLKKSKELLNESGYPEGFSCELLFATGNNSNKELATRISQNADKVGIKIKLIELSFKSAFNRVINGKFDLFLLGYLASPDPDLFLTPHFTKNGSFNYTGYSNLKLTELLKKARKTTDIKTREKLYKESQLILYKEIPYIPLYSDKARIAYNKNIKNLLLNAYGIIIFKNAYIE